MADLFITPTELLPRLHLASAPAILDLRTKDDACADPTRLPAAWRLTLTEIEAGGGPGKPAVVYCQRGGKISQLGAAMLRARGQEARVLTGGHLAWAGSGHPVQALDLPAARWVMSQAPDPDALSALWLLRRLVDPRAPVLSVAADQLGAAAAVWDAAVLPATPQGLAALAGSTHDLAGRLSRVPEDILRGRLARCPDPLDALDLIDDMLAGALPAGEGA